MKYIKFFAVIALFSILITSCGKKSKLGKLIPREAAVVIDLNTKSLLSKLPWDEIKKTFWYNELMSDSSISATSKTFMGDPAKTGIDIHSDLVFFVLQPDSNGHVVFEGSLKDSKAFSDFLKSMHPNGTTTKEGDINLYKTNEAVMGWNEERFICVSNADHHKFMHRDMNDSANTPLAPATPDNLVKVCKDLFSLSDDNSLYKNEKFATLTDEEGDVHFWMNVNELSRGAIKNLPPMVGMVNLDKFLVDNFTAATVSFKDGQITAKHKQYYSKELSDILKKGDGNINTDMIKRLPSQNLAGIFSVHFTPANLLEIIKLTGLDGFVTLFLAQQGLTLDDVVKATKGDMLFAVSDITTKSDTVNLETTTKDSIRNYYQKPYATVLFAVAIGDKDAFNKVIGLGDKMGKEESMKNIFRKSDDKYFAVSNKQDAVNKYFSGNPSTPEFLSKINDHPMGGFVDIQMILKSMQAELTKDSTGKIYYDRNLAMWNNVYFTGGEYKDGGLVSNAELNLVDKSTNSLRQLNQFVDDIAKVAVAQKKKQKLEHEKNLPMQNTIDSIARVTPKEKLHNKTRK